MVTNAVVWFDLPTADFERAVGFYSTILGEDIRVDEMEGKSYGFFPMVGMEGAGGALVPPGPENHPSENGTRVYLSCEGKIDTVLSRVEAAGGKIIDPKSFMEGAGWIAMIRDTEGNIVGLHSSI